MKFSRTLIITAHPSKNGWVSHMAVEAQKIIEDKGGVCTVIDLYHTDLYQVYYGSKTDKQTVLEHQKLISGASDIILMYPMWWGSVPAIMKNWMDSNFEPLFAYEYKQDTLWHKLTKLPFGKLRHTRIHQVVTAGGDAWKYALLLSFPTNTIRLVFIAFCWMKQGFVKMYGGIAHMPKDKRAWMVEDFKRWFGKKIN